jgi:hypothetical protein
MESSRQRRVPLSGVIQGKPCGLSIAKRLNFVIVQRKMD